jgi:transposase-like protein
MNRTRHSLEFKMKIAKEVEETENGRLVARKHNLSPSMVARWYREYKTGMRDCQRKKLTDTSPANTNSGFDNIKQENEQLRKIVAEKTLENEILRELVKKQNPHLMKSLK